MEPFTNDGNPEPTPAPGTGRNHRRGPGTGASFTVGVEDLSDKFHASVLRQLLVDMVTTVDPTKPIDDARMKAFVSGAPMPPAASGGTPA